MNNDYLELIKRCKSAGCFVPSENEVLGAYANTPEWLRIFCAIKERKE